ncbi:MAG: uroporphyrinogen-III C-methyltransferase [Planctomycetota bacterium]
MSAIPVTRHNIGMSGRVFLIGAGPGNPGLLTLRGAELLGQSDVVLYDGLSNPEMLRHAASAEHVCVGKHGRTRIWKQHEIIDEILRHARAGRRVARLKGGDPAVFARTAEEVAAVREAGIPLEVVPGITAALAAGSFAGIPITHRGLASAVALVTGHEEPSKAESALDWGAIARFPGTVVVYMGVTTARAWTDALLSAGKPPETPAAIIRRCSLPDQQVIRCELNEVADHLTPASKFRPPVIVILGAVAELADTINWVQSQPLLGQNILVTRPTEQATALADSLSQLGAQVVQQPVIEIGPVSDWNKVDQTLCTLGDFQHIVFCSHNGVRYFMNRLFALGRDVRSLAGIEISVVGEKTAQTLREFSLIADRIPDDFRAESLAHSMGDGVRDRNVLIIRASRGRDVLADALEANGARVQQLVTYEHRDVENVDPNVMQAVTNGQIEWITLTSSASAENAAKLFGDAMRKMKIATLSPVTSEQVRDLGFEVTAEANPYTIEAMIQSIQEAMK